MDRKGTIAVTLSIIVLVAWWYYNNGEMKKLAAQKAAQQAEVQAMADAQAKLNPPAATPAPGAAAPANGAAPAGPATAANGAAPAAPVEPVVPEKLETLDTESVGYTFSTHGGGIARALLKKHEGERGTRMTLNEFGDVPIGAVSELASVPYLYAKPAEGGGGEVTITAPGHAKGQELFLSFSTGNLADGKWNGKYAITAATAATFTVALPKGTLPESTSGTVQMDVPGDRWTKAPFTYAVDRDDGVITFEGHDPSLLHLTKKFSVPKSTSLSKDYIVTMRLVFQNRGKEPMTVPGYFVHTGSAAPVHPRDLPTYTGFKIPGTKFVDVTSFRGGWFSTAHASFIKSQPNIPWAAVADQYFTTLIAPTPEPKASGDDAARALGTPAPPNEEGNAAWAKPFIITDEEWKGTSHEVNGSKTERQGIEGAIGMPGFTLAPGEMHVQSFHIYAGPREYGRLRLMPNGEVDVLAFSDFGGIFALFGPFVGFLSKILLFSLNSIHAWVGSYAWAIILLTLVIKGLLWPMQNKATRSAKRMQLLQPKMTEIKDKYKDDPTRMNTEVMKLYKDYGVNPLSGCLPALIQMPVFIGLYNMLGKAVELRNSKFLWVHDLSQPDTVFHLNIPGLFDLPVNVLPLCMAVTMVWQMMASPKAGDASQQKMMMFMPLVFVLFCYNYASALALYLIVNNLVSVVQLYATRNQAPPTLQKRPPPSKRK